MAHADATAVTGEVESRTNAPLIPLSEIALTGIYEISKILNAPNRLETTLSNVLNVLSSFLQMRHGVISLLADDDVPDITVGVGWNEGADSDTARACRKGRSGRSLRPRFRWSSKMSPPIRCSRPADASRSAPRTTPGCRSSACRSGSAPRSSGH